MQRYVNSTVIRLNEVVNEVNAGAATLASASEEVAAAAQSLSEAASEANAGGDSVRATALAMRRLAERSKVAASSVELSSRAGDLLERMVPSLRRTSELVLDIATASNDQSASVQQIGGAIVQLDQTTQYAATNAEEMSRQAKQLQQLTSFFRPRDMEPQGRSKPVTVNELPDARRYATS